MVRKTNKQKMVKINELKNNEEFAPKSDPKFNRLIVDAAQGRLPVYRALISTSRLRRFDNTHRPDLTVSGKSYVAQIIAAWVEGGMWPMWVYPSGNEFIASDDYFTFAAYEQGQLANAACHVLGKPDRELVADLHGQLTADQVKKAMGFS